MRLNRTFDDQVRWERYVDVVGRPIALRGNIVALLNSVSNASRRAFVLREGSPFHLRSPGGGAESQGSLAPLTPMLCNGEMSPCWKPDTRLSARSHPGVPRFAWHAGTGPLAAGIPVKRVQQRGLHGGQSDRLTRTRPLHLRAPAASSDLPTECLHGKVNRTTTVRRRLAAMGRRQVDDVAVPLGPASHAFRASGEDACRARWYRRLRIGLGGLHRQRPGLGLRYRVVHCDIQTAKSSNVLSMRLRTSSFVAESARKQFGSDPRASSSATNACYACPVDRKLPARTSLSVKASAVRGDAGSRGDGERHVPEKRHGECAQEQRGVPHKQDRDIETADP